MLVSFTGMKIVKDMKKTILMTLAVILAGAPAFAKGSHRSQESFLNQATQADSETCPEAKESLDAGTSTAEDLEYSASNLGAAEDRHAAEETNPVRSDLPNPMTLKDCMEYAISNSTKVRIQQAANDDASLARRDAIFDAFTPEISGSGAAYYNFGRAVDPKTNTYVTTTSFHNSYGVSAGVTLFNGFKAVNNLKISKTSMALGNSQEDQIEADICLATMEAYCNVLYYSRLADIYKSQVKVAEESLAKARRQEELGQKGHADVVEMDSNLADKQYQYVETVNKLNDAKITLEDVMFWSEDRELVIDTELPSTLDGERLLTDSLAVEDIVEYAQDNNPAAKVAKYNLLNAKRELATSRWQLLPSLSAYAGWSTTYFTYPGSTSVSEPFKTQFKNNGGEYVQLSLSIPIFSGLQRHSNIARKKNAVAKASAEYDQKMREVSAEVRRAVQDRDGASAAYIQAQRKSDVQEEAYALNMKKLEQGLISPIEFQTASNNYLEANAQRLNSLLTYFIKRSVVNYYNGVDYINQ